MPSTLRLLASCLAISLALLAASVPVAAAAKRITGKLSEPGYTVLALGARGEATSDVARRGEFGLRPAARSVTLHLKAVDGTYAGPIVLDSEKGGKRAILGVKAGASLGRVKVDAREGYAKVKRRLPHRSIAPEQKARAKGGVPIGAGNFGWVRSRNTRGGVPGDRDLEGVPDPLDISDDGDLVLDNFERSTRRGVRTDASQVPGAPLYLRSGLEQIRIETTVNANAANLAVEDINDVLSTYGRITLDVPAPHTSVELDCGGLPVDPNDLAAGWTGGRTYCTPGGSGTWFWPPVAQQGDEFPECCDPDANGYGTIVTQGVGGFQLLHHADTRDPDLDPDEPQPGTVGTGDILTERVPCPDLQTGEPLPGTDCPATLQTALATVPALVAYSDTEGNCAEVPVPGRDSTCETKFSYPVPPGGLGTEGNGFPVAAGPNGIEVTFTFWRPQRRPIGFQANREACLDETPPCKWVDIGNLVYQTAFGCSATDASGNPVYQGCGNKYCPPNDGPPDAYSLPAGSELTPTTMRRDEGGLDDTAPDRPASPQNFFTYTVNLSECLRDPRGFEAPDMLPWDLGVEWQLVFPATNGLDSSEQIIYFRRVG